MIKKQYCIDKIAKKIFRKFKKICINDIKNHRSFMNTINNSKVSFKGYDNIFAARHKNAEAEAYVITMRLNNEGVKDLDRFEHLIDKNSNDKFLTIHYESIKNQVPGYPDGNSIISLNDFPLILDKKQLMNADLSTIKEVEKISLPLTQNVVNLLKRVSQENSRLSDSSLATFTAIDKTINSMCGKFVDVPGFKDVATQIIMKDQYGHGDVNIIRDTCKTIIDVITNKMFKYFK